MKKAQKGFDHNAENVVENGSTKLTAWGLDCTAQDLNEKVTEIVKDSAKVGAKVSILAENLEKSLSVRELATMLSIMMKQKIDSVNAKFAEASKK